MNIMEAVQRLEELAVDLDCEELQGIANALDLADGQDCPKCKNYEMDRQFLSEMHYRLERMGYGSTQRLRDHLRENHAADAMHYMYSQQVAAQLLPAAKLLDTGT